MSVQEVIHASVEPLYNIGVVSRMTGLSMATLRAWERRYEFPSSERTAGGHRLYSEHDVLALRWVKSRIDEGMQTAQAIHALQHQEHTGESILTETKSRELSRVKTLIPLHLSVYLEKITQALINKDIQTAEVILNEVLATSSPEDVILEIVGPAMAKIGEEWEKGKTSISTEHLATNFLRQRLLMWMLSGPPTRTSKPVLLSCGPNEWHEGSLLVLGALLRRRRWPVAYLGQSVPLDDLSGFIKDIDPSLVILVAMTEGSAMELIKWPKIMPEVFETGKPIIGYGGRIFSIQPEWRLKMPGLYLGNSFRDGLDTIERLL
jgi:MerR family transcriptional regulator, light-induced transcriptional regulator